MRRPVDPVLGRRRPLERWEAAMKRIRRSQSGQALMESLMLALFLVVVTQLTFKLLGKADLFQRVLGDPWVKMLNVIHYGVSVDDEKKARALHPVNIGRHQTQIVN